MKENVCGVTYVSYKVGMEQEHKNQYNSDLTCKSACTFSQAKPGVSPGIHFWAQPHPKPGTCVCSFVFCEGCVDIICPACVAPTVCYAYHFVGGAALSKNLDDMPK